MHYLSANLFNDNLAQALSWTLIHSLWQGALLAIFAAVVIQFTKKTRPSLRYNLLGFLFFSFIVATIVTFFWMLKGNMQPETLINRRIVLTGNAITPDLLTQGTSTNVWRNFINFFNAYNNIIVAVWFMVFSIKSIRLLKGLKQVYGIRHSQIGQPGPYWIGRVQELAQGLEIKKKIQLFESGMVNMPMVIGFLKPVILIPFGLWAKLPPEQVEIILLHELAHIRRGDYFINLMQNIVETLFFFNPFLLWISALLREERENCCDDLAVSHTKNKALLVNALIFFQENTMPAGARLSMGFGKTKGQLLNRVKRVASDRNKSLSKAEKGFLSICLLVVAGFAIGFSGPNPGNRAAVTIQQGSRQAIVQNTTIEAVNLAESQDTLKVTMAIKADLIKDGVIEDSGALSFTLNNTTLIVNGKKQADYLYQQLKEKYVSRKGWSISYNNHSTVRKTVNAMS